MKNTIKNYRDSVIIRSIVMAIPYLGPFIDNALVIPQTNRERKNQEAFFEGLAKDIELLKEKLPSGQVEPSTSIFPKILEYIGHEDDDKKILFYRNLFLSHDLYKSIDGSSNIDVWPRHFVWMIEKYTKSHFDTLLYLHETFFEVEWVSIKKGEFDGFYKHLNIPGGSFMRILMDFERDSLIDIFFLNNQRRSDLNMVEYIQQTPMWDEFFVAVIEPPFRGI